ncbi:MAG: hypothetical protein RJA33_602 [Actinomycetota bacterium]|jgi:hypothetical protein
MSITKPAQPSREFIAPSDLTFGFSTCKRCIWIKYWYSFELKKDFPLVKTLSTVQEELFRRAPMPSLDPSLAPGVVKQWGQWVKSRNIVINGVETPWKLRGIYDLLGHYEDGSVGIIDCKVSDSDRDNGDFYAPQLEAYAFTLENPLSGKAFSVSTMGLLIWKLAGVAQTRPNEFVSNEMGFGVNQLYVPVARDPERLARLLEEFISVIDGDCPDAGADCHACNFFEVRGKLES